MCQGFTASAAHAPGQDVPACPVCRAPSTFRYSYTLDGYDYYTCAKCHRGVDVRAADEP